MPRAARACSSSQKSRRAGVDARGRLVEQEQLGLMQHAGGEREALLPAAGERSGELRGAAAEAQAFDRPVDGGAALRHAVDAGDEVEVLADREVLPEREALRHVADAPLDLAALLDDVVAEAGAGAGVGRQQPAYDADRGRLAAAVGPEEAEDLAAPDLQRQVVDDMLVAEALVQPANIDGPGLGRCAHCGVTDTGCPGRRRAALSGDGRASTRNTSLARVSLL